MAAFGQIRGDVPELADRAQRVFDAYKHKTIATLRLDGSPRISGIELDFLGDDVWFGSMPGSRKSADMKRDPRFAIHSTSADPELANGDAKLAGRAELAKGALFRRYVEHRRASGLDVPEDDFDLFRGDIEELVVIRIGEPADHLVIETWRAESGYSRVERR